MNDVSESNMKEEILLIEPANEFLFNVTRCSEDLCVPVPYRNLFRCSENGTDSYARLYLLPDQSWRHRKRTHVKKRTVNPVFNDK